MCRCASPLLTLVLAACAATTARALFIESPRRLQGFYPHYKVESSAPLPEQSSQLSDRVFIPELVGGSDPPGAGGVMLLTKEQYGHDPGTKWQDEVNRLGCLAVILVEEEGAMLYRRWDPYTSMTVPVLQVSYETGAAIRAALLEPPDYFVSVLLYTNRARASDKEVLRQLYNDYRISGDGRRTFYLTGWFKMDNASPELYADVDPCLELFPGVDCDEFGAVSHLQLRAVNGRNNGVPELIGDLTNLTSLYLFDSELGSRAGQSLPENLGDLKALELLRIEEANLVGTIPAALGRPPRMRRILLARNSLSGTMPSVLVDESTITVELDLSGNKLTGTIPAQFMASPTLQVLRLSSNLISGTLPSLSTVANLRLLSVRENRLSGAIPPGPFPPNLYELDLGRNGFRDFSSGQSPTAWSGMQSLQTLVLDNNNLTFASFPRGLRMLTSLKTLVLNDNKLRCNFPQMWAALGKLVPVLNTLVLSGNEMYGDIAQSSKLLLPQFTSLTTLGLARNLLGYDYSQACTLMGWESGAACVAESNSLNQLQTCSNARSPKNDDCLFHNALPALLPPLIRTADFSYNYFGDALPSLYGDYEMLESLDVRGNVVESAEEAVRTLQWRNTPRALPSWASPGATRLKYSDAGGQYHCPLLTLFGRPQRSLWVDPFYYEWSLCECEYGFYVNPTETAQPPHCTPFPTRVNVTGRVGSFSDGVMGGRVRTGMDTKWHLKANPAALVDPNATSAASPPRVLAINLLVEELDLGNESTIFVYAGDSRLDRRVARLSGEETTQDTVSITVLHSEALLWFESPDDVGPHWTVRYETFVDPFCPPETHQLSVGAVSDPVSNELLNLCWPSCEAGHYARIDVVDYIRYECTMCNQDEYQETAGFQTECTECPVGSTTAKRLGSTRLTDCECQAGQAGNFELMPGANECAICTQTKGEGFECPGGSKVFVNADVYKARESYLEYSCPLVDSCLQQPADSEGLDYPDSSEAYCARGTSGPLCAVCGYGPYGGEYYVNGGVECRQCPSLALSILSLFFILLFLSAFLVGMFHVDPAQQTAIFKILNSFMQVVYIYVTYVDLQWPPQFISWFKWTGIANLAVLDLSPVDCMGSKKRISYYTRHTMESLLLPGIMVLFAVIYIVGMWTLRRYFSNKQAMSRMMASAADTMGEGANFISKSLSSKSMVKKSQENASPETQNPPPPADAADATGGTAEVAEQKKEAPKEGDGAAATEQTEDGEKTTKGGESDPNAQSGPGPVTEGYQAPQGRLFGPGPVAEKSGFAASVAKAAPGAAASKDAPDKAKPSALQGLFAAAGGAGGDAGWNKELLRYTKLRVVFKRRCTNNVLWILCMLYPGVAGTCIAFFKCKKVGREHYLQTDYNINCSSDEYLEYSGVAGLCVFIFVICTPACIVAFLMLNRLSSRMQRWELDKSPDPMDALAEFRRPKVPRLGRFTKWVMSNVSGGALESITGPYTNKCFYWEVNEMLRKTSLVCITVFLAGSRAGLEMLVISLFQTLSLTQHLVLMPFKLDADHHAQTVALVAEVITMQIAAGIASGAFADKLAVGILLIIVNMGTLLALVVAGALVLVANDASSVVAQWYKVFRRVIGKPLRQTKEEQAEHMQSLEMAFARRWGGDLMKGTADANTFSMALNPKSLVDQTTGAPKAFKSNYVTMFQGQLPRNNVVASVAPAPLSLTQGGPGAEHTQGAMVPVSPSSPAQATAISEHELQHLINSLRVEREPQDILEKLAEITQNKTDEDIRRRVVEAGSIPLLVGFLTPSWRTNIMPSKEEQAKFRWALQTLTHITRTRDYRDTVREAGLLPKLVALLQMRKLPSSLQQAVLQSTINVTAGNKPNQVMLQEEGVPLLLARAMDSVTKLPDSDSSADTFRFMVLALNAVLTADMPYEEKNELVQAGGLQALIISLGPGHVDAHVDAVQSINKLCSSNIGLCTQLRELNGIPALVFLLDWEHSSPSTIKSVIIALMNCTRRDVLIRDSICAIGGVAPIIGLMGREQERIIVEKATWTLNNLSTGSEENQGAVRHAGGVKATLSVLEWARDAPTMKAALATLIHLSESSETALAVQEANGIPILVKHAKGQVPNAHKDIALLALNKLAMAHPGCSDEVQELVGNDMWESVQVAVLPGTAATSGGASAAVENRL